MTNHAVSELTAEEREAIQEFRRKPVDQHPPFLQQRLNIMRGEPVEGKHVLFCTIPHRERVENTGAILHHESAVDCPRLALEP